MVFKSLHSVLILIHIFLICLMLGLFPAQAQESSPPKDSCLVLIGENIALSREEGYLYQEFSDEKILIKQGDALEYDIFIAKSSPSPRCGLDVEFEKRESLRDHKELKDQNDLMVHADAILAPASGKWHHRRFSLDIFAGTTTQAWCAVLHGSEFGRYTMFLDNVMISRADGAKILIYETGEPRTNKTRRRESYSQFFVMQSMPKRDINESADIEKLTEPVISKGKKIYDIKILNDDLDMAEKMIARFGNDPEKMKIVRDVRDSLKEPPALLEKNEAEFREFIKTANEKLNSITLAPVREYTGRLVGHAHIDTQWLWEWPETIREFKDTFTQALAFMDEFPGFTFTQSSSVFYQATEYHWPDLFKKIRERVKSGEWEIVGGRMTEADNNLISGESHAREFLYGQRFFRERFEGKQAVVAWEPDTFGHNAQMPQIVKNGGCHYYYFCRTGPETPLFWWVGLDGTRILAFREVNSWYNSDLSGNQFEETWDFEKRTGSKDMLWVYGVGNHGGGPTREYLNVADSWMKRRFLPTVKFSTATAFFQTLEKKYDLKNLPVVPGELNYVFEGCYTSHGDIKRMNNEAQAMTVSAEALAAIAAQYGFSYPGTQLRQNWEDICWNQHHDTIDGTAIHPPYQKSREVFGRVRENNNRIIQEALAFLSGLVDCVPDTLLVFNPVGCPRDAIIEYQIPEGRIGKGMTALAGGSRSSIQMLQPEKRLGIFLAHDLPPYGYRVYRLTKEVNPTQPFLNVSPDGTILENDNLKLVLNPQTGAIKSLLDKKTGREFVLAGGSINRQEIHWEKSADAWNIGAIAKMETLDSPVSLEVLEKGPVRANVSFTRKFRENTITQNIMLCAGSDMVECEMNVDWKETGEGNPELLPFLKLAMDVNVKDGEANFDIPFGNVLRPKAGHEVPALKWCDVSNKDCGFSLINDSKHGHSVTTDTIRLSIVRAFRNPDATSDNYIQTVRYALYPHQGDWKSAGTVARGFAWIQPAIPLPITKKGTGALPSECSFVRTDVPNVMITAVKRAEDDDDMIVRFYESSGAPTESSLRSFWSIVSAKWTNFLEDPVGETATVKNNMVKMQLNGYQIGTLKLNLKPQYGVTLTGTRGPGPIRPF